MHCRISPRRTCRYYGFTVKISTGDTGRKHRHLIYIVERNAETDGMGPFKRRKEQTETGRMTRTSQVVKVDLW